ncbi:MAG: autoinducer binding domain-containing protein [Sphingobium sp.]
MNQDIVPELDQIGLAKTPGELWRTMRRYFRGRGFEGLGYFLANRHARSPVRGFALIHRGFSREVSRRYIDEGWGTKDPGPAFALAQGCPVRWSDSFRSMDMDEEQAHFLAAMREVNLGDGYSLPVYGPRGRHGALAIGNARRADALNKAPLDEMHLIAQAAHMRLCQLLPDTILLDKPLSARELEILEWVARGKSNGVIADILDLSAGTVDTYLRRIFDKLDVSDRTSAAVRGVGMGLIAA